jgi:hypothetical protein
VHPDARHRALVMSGAAVRYRYSECMTVLVAGGVLRVGLWFGRGMPGVISIFGL